MNKAHSYNVRVVCSALAMMLLGCGDVPSSPRPGGPATPRFNVESFQGSLGILDPTDSYATMSLPEYADPIIVEVGLLGTIGTSADDRTSVVPYNGQLDGSGIFVTSVYNSCYAHVTFHWPTPPYGMETGPKPCRIEPRTQDVWYDTLLAQGAGQVTRARGIPQFTDDCGGTPCHSYTGSQSITVRPIPVDLVLRASSRFITPPSYVTFTPAVVPDYLKGFKVPLRVVSWQWVPVGGSGQTLACGPGVSVCTTEVKEAGTMTVTAVVNGVEQTSSVRIEAVPCVVGDSLIDNPVLRAGLAAAWNESRSDFPIDLRIERGMYLFDSSNVYTYRLTPINPTVDGPCRNAATPVFPFPGRAVTGGHTHPFALGDSLPALCRPPNLPPWAFTTYGNPYGGPSAPDWVRSWNDSLPHVVIDKDSIYRIHPHPIDSVQGPTEWQYFPTPGWESKYLAAPRVVGSCVRI